MAGVAAGVVGAAEVNSQPRQPTKFNMKLQSPSTWTYIWVAAAFLYLIGTYIGLIRLRSIGT